MPNSQRDPMSEAPHERRDRTTDDDLNREDITPGERDTEQERGYHEPGKGQSGPTDPDSAFSDVDRDDTVDE